MPIITILPHSELCPKGKSFEVNKGDNLCKVLLKNNVDIEHACEMSRACTTCHLSLIHI